MRATYECELCFEEYEDEDSFVRCHGDACREEVCINCAKKCKDPTCKQYICEQCQDDYGSYMGEYCIDCAMWDDLDDRNPDDADEEDDLWNGETRNFDYVARGLTHDAGLAFLKEDQHRRLEAFRERKRREREEEERE